MYKKIRKSLLAVTGFLNFVVRNFIGDNCTAHAAALTYTTLFAVVPVLTVSFAILSAVPSMQAIDKNIRTYLYQHFVPSAGTSVEAYLDDFTTQASHMTAVGLCMLFVTVIMMLITVQSAFNQIWRVRQPPQSVISVLRYWAVVSLGPLLLGVGFAISSFLTSIDFLSRSADFVSNIIPGLGLVPLLFSACGFTLIYIAMPHSKVSLRAGIFGGVSAAILFEAAMHGFSFFITHFSSYKLIYGAFAAFPIFLLWIYLSWLIVLFGVELTRAFMVFQGANLDHRHPLLSLLGVLQLFYQKHQKGEAVSDGDVLALLGRQDHDTWGQFSSLLLDQRIIRCNKDGDYVLGRNLDQLDFWDFYLKLPWPLPGPADLTTSGPQDQWSEVLRPLLIRVNHQVEHELHIPLGHVLAKESSVALVSSLAPRRDPAA